MGDNFHEQQHAAIMAVKEVLTAEQQKFIEESAARRWPRMAGALTADILDYLADYDMFLSIIEPFFERDGEVLPKDPRVTYIVYALIMLEKQLTVESVLSLLAQADVHTNPTT